MKQTGIEAGHFFWVLHVLCALHRKPFSAEMARQQAVTPYTRASLFQAIDACGFDVVARKAGTAKLCREPFPLLVWLRVVDGDADAISQPATSPQPVQQAAQKTTQKTTQQQYRPAFVMEADSANILVFSMDSTTPVPYTHKEFSARYDGHCLRVTPKEIPLSDTGEGDIVRHTRRFGFAWFVPELLKHRKLWHEILLASLVIQLIALATPLFTQTIIDKVIANRTQSTLVAIVVGMAVCMVFSALLTWLRQYLVLHTGNRVDAVLGATVFDHLLKLPLVYFQHRPTGVIAARLHGIETIREFIASAAVTLLLDLPFLLIFVAVMLYYSVVLTCIVIAVLTLIVVLSVVSAPLFQVRLQAQFSKGARNQAFLTEYVAGMETVKSLQLEPQLCGRYSQYFAQYLQAGFSARQLGNTYNTLANLLEQVMSLLILGIGAYIVMHSVAFTIGMLVAFQMFAGKLSQPMLRLVGLWQQFQQARLSVDRLGDLMNAPIEPYSMTPMRLGDRQGHVVMDRVSFRYEASLPYVYQGLSLSIQPGQMVAIMGVSGSGKSTLTKLLQGFYQPDAGRILLDGIDIAHLSANELRSYFGVVPQETTLFSGTIYDNLHMANPNAGFEKIITACKMAEIHAVIEALPNAYQTEIGERGAGLSGGQKQRIAIARALLKTPAILVFDEATSALDNVTSAQLAHTINALKGRVTILFITHGMPASLDVDALYQLTPQGLQAVHGSNTSSHSHKDCRVSQTGGAS